MNEKIHEAIHKVCTPANGYPPNQTLFLEMHLNNVAAAIDDSGVPLDELKCVGWNHDDAEFMFPEITGNGAYEWAANLFKEAFIPDGATILIYNKNGMELICTVDMCFENHE